MTSPDLAAAAHPIWCPPPFGGLRFHPAPMNSDNPLVAAARAAGEAHQIPAGTAAVMALREAACIAAMYGFRPGPFHFDIPDTEPLDGRPMTRALLLLEWEDLMPSTARVQDGYAKMCFAVCAADGLLLSHGLCATWSLMWGCEYLEREYASTPLMAPVRAIDYMREVCDGVWANPERIQQLAAVLLSARAEFLTPTKGERDRANVRFVMARYAQEFASTWSQLREDLGRHVLDQARDDIADDEVLQMRSGGDRNAAAARYRATLADRCSRSSLIPDPPTAWDVLIGEGWNIDLSRGEHLPAPRWIASQF
jgi:hypothetical protein